MKLVTALLALSLTLSGCMVPTPPAPLAPPAPALSPQHMATHAVVVANPDAVRVLGSLRARAITLTPSDVSRVDLLAGSPGFAWWIGPPRQESLHIHAYRDRPSAAAAAQRFVAAAMARSQIIDWAGRPQLFQCGTAVALYLGQSPQALNILTNQCGPPAWRG